MWAEETTTKLSIVNISIRKSLLLACLDLQMLQPRLLSFIAVEVPQNDICDHSILARAFHHVHIPRIFESCI